MFVSKSLCNIAVSTFYGMWHQTMIKSYEKKTGNKTTWINAGKKRPYSKPSAFSLKRETQALWSIITLGEGSQTQGAWLAVYTQSEASQSWLSPWPSPLGHSRGLEEEEGARRTHVSTSLRHYGSGYFGGSLLTCSKLCLNYRCEAERPQAVACCCGWRTSLLVAPFF